MKVGDRVAKNHVYAGPIAQGGFATVSLVVRREGSFERLYALKRPHPHMLADTEMRELFLEEGRIAGLLRHANVISVLDVGEDTHGPYMLMPFVDGVSLAAIVRRAAEAGDLLPVSVVLQIVDQAAKGLSAAHELRDHDGVPVELVHRDISPQNILIDFDGNVLILDFGIAKVLSGGGETTANLLKGKVGYMAPEQLRFERVTPQTDLYSLGVVLYETLAARRLHSSRDVSQIAQAVLKGPPPDISESRSDTPERLDRLLFELLAKDRAHRPASANAVSETIREIAHELYADDDWVELRDFMRDDFAHERDERQQDRKTKLTVARRNRSRRWMLPAAAVALAVCSLVATAITMSYEGETSEAFTPLPPTAVLPTMTPQLAPTGGIIVIPGAAMSDSNGSDETPDTPEEPVEEVVTMMMPVRMHPRPMRPSSPVNMDELSVGMDWW